MIDATSSPGVDAVVNYYVPNSDGSPPATNDMAIMLGQKDMISHKMRIRDLRPYKEQYSLDRNGFQYATLHSTLKDATDEGQIKKVYYGEIEKLVKDVTGAKRVLAFHHAIRTRTGNEYGEQIKDRYQGVEGPAYRVHIDQTPQGALSIVQFMFPDLAEEVRNGSFQVINVWRPLTRVKRDPLMVADTTEMPPEDLLLINRKYYNGLHSSNFVIKYDGRPATGEGPTDGLSSGGKHSWWYIGDQEPTEALIFSSSGFRNGKAIIGTAHGAFCLPDQDQYPARQSIECRCVAIY
ncbi:uncharacterized protein NFIA_009820 [Aspergillus fischeri NRRL 181]|uniref:Methyltransferase n=1 Tax=Neosartorya fischeri (strain ATCC 1020 / DSM 3700 / CBS 544.65 / FGSC A1164 / JCM 1740 / NRRL 181 / WB 181) TaxID=331117 RepID=A1D1K9_NEOFI|nr:conserved hypothetical protein [Aspergillus fischeri NRRL 181]EAW22302.1 conserved hypothetical protein [Aspergillus fischeri NRRL 181]KAG2012500.1 hypothetical protein GB937_007095 [Aspergillus fischeri]